MTVLDLPSRWDELEDGSRLRLLFEDGAETHDGRPAINALRLREAPVRAGADQCDLATAEALARRLAPLHVVTAGVEAEPAGAGEITGPVRLHGPARARRRPPLRPRLGVAHPPRPRPAPGADRARRRWRADPPGHQGVRPAGHGPARAGDRRDRLRQVGVPAHAGARPRDHPLARAAEHGAGRLQGRRDVRGHVRDAPRLRDDHQPRERADPRRPHAGRALRGDGAPPGAAARRRQLRVGARLRARPDRRRGPRPPAVAVHRGRRVLRDALGQAGVHRPLRRHRPPRPVARPPPAARLAAAGGGPAPRPRVAPVLPGRAADVLGPGVAHGARRPRRLRAAADAGAGVPQARPVDRC